MALLERDDLVRESGRLPVALEAFPGDIALGGEALCLAGFLQFRDELGGARPVFRGNAVIRPHGLELNRPLRRSRERFEGVAAAIARAVVTEPPLQM